MTTKRRVPKDDPAIMEALEPRLLLSGFTAPPELVHAGNAFSTLTDSPGILGYGGGNSVVTKDYLELRGGIAGGAYAQYTFVLPSSRLGTITNVNIYLQERSKSGLGVSVLANSQFVGSVDSLSLSQWPTTPIHVPVQDLCYDEMGTELVVGINVGLLNTSDIGAVKVTYQFTPTNITSDDFKVYYSSILAAATLDSFKQAMPSFSLWDQNGTPVTSTTNPVGYVANSIGGFAQDLAKMGDYSTDSLADSLKSCKSVYDDFRTASSDFDQFLSATNLAMLPNNYTGPCPGDISTTSGLAHGFLAVLSRLDTDFVALARQASNINPSSTDRSQCLSALASDMLGQSWDSSPEMAHVSGALTGTYDSGINRGTLSQQATAWTKAWTDVVTRARYSAGSQEATYCRQAETLGNMLTSFLDAWTTGVQNTIQPSIPVGYSPVSPSGQPPSSIGTLTPTFTWSAFAWSPYTTADPITFRQKGYELKVTCDTDGNKVAYDSGFVSGTATAAMCRSPLQNGKTYHWAVRYEDLAGKWTPWSTPRVGNEDTFIVQLRPTISLSGNNITILSGDNSPRAADGTDFGSLTANTGLAAHTFSVLNLGGGVLNLTGLPDRISVSGQNADDFTIASQPAAAVPGGGRCTFRVFFRPGAAGLRTATISIATNDPSCPVYTFAVQGTGVVAAPPPASAPKISIMDDSGNSADNTVSLADTPNGQSSTAQYFVLSNTGKGTLNVTNLATGGANQGDFIIGVRGDTGTAVSGSHFSIPAGHSYIISATFRPTGIGLRTANVVFNTNDPTPGSGTVQLSLSGNGIGSSVWQADAGIRIPGGTNPAVISRCIVHRPDGLWAMYFYQGDAESYGDTGYATSPDGITWTVGTKVMLHGGNGFDNVNAVIADVVVLPNGRYRAYCEGMQSNSGNAPTSIFVADSPDGITWTKGQVLFNGNTGVGQVSGPRVYAYGSGYVMYFNRGTTVQRTTSSDGLTWATPETVVSSGVESFDIIQHAGGPWRMFAAKGDGTIGALTSDDGITWVWDAATALAPSAFGVNGRLGSPIVVDIGGVVKLYVTARPNPANDLSNIYSASSIS